MDYPQNLLATDCHWFDLIQECRTSGKSDTQWLQEHNIKSPTFYYHVKRLRKKACDIPATNHSRRNDIQEVVPLIIEEPTQVISSDCSSVNVFEHTVSVRLNIKWRHR